MFSKELSIKYLGFEAPERIIYRPPVKEIREMNVHSIGYETTKGEKLYITPEPSVKIDIDFINEFIKSCENGDCNFKDYPIFVSYFSNRITN